MNDNSELPTTPGSVVQSASLLMLTRFGNWVSEGVFTVTSESLIEDGFEIVFDAGAATSPVEWEYGVVKTDDHSTAFVWGSDVLFVCWSFLSSYTDDRVLARRIPATDTTPSGPWEALPESPTTRLVANLVHSRWWVMNSRSLYGRFAICNCGWASPTYFRYAKALAAGTQHMKESGR